jgi:class 3 adenylate cyclase
MNPPRTKYARSGDLSIAYQVTGEGPIDLIFVPGWMSHLELDGEEPVRARFFQRLASFSRLVRFDKRGTGLSDPVPAAPTLEQRIDDLLAVMDAVGMERAALFGHSEGGQMSLLFAATYPQRTQAIIPYGTFAKATADSTYPWGLPPGYLRQAGDAVEHWGEGRGYGSLNPRAEFDPRLVEAAARRERMCASPGMARALHQALLETDLRHILPSVRVPTLVLHRRDEPILVENGRYIAEHVPGARIVELEGGDHAPWLGDTEAVVGETELFLTGARHSYETDRVLATVLFTDIVGSTERAATLGDRRWRDLLDAHHAVVRRELDRFRGREVHTAGDGFLATFDGPARAIRCAAAVVQAVRPLGIEIRAGLHTGEIEIMGRDVGGIAVHIGARVAAEAGPGEILVSSTVKDLVAGSGLAFEERGSFVLKGIPDQWRLFAAAPS